jgi:hypothetical protein
MTTVFSQPCSTAVVQIAATVGVTVSLLLLVVRPGRCVDVIVVVEVLFGEAGVNALRGQTEKKQVFRNLYVFNSPISILGYCHQ